LGKKQKNIRLWFQAAWFAVTNGYAKGFLEGKIYKGQIKYVCVPGLNCYSCPGALGSCPIGSLQAVLDSGKFRVSCYVFGFLMLFGALLGRFVDGSVHLDWYRIFCTRFRCFEKRKICQDIAS
jgi:ferredoxin-type protein NapH